MSISLAIENPNAIISTGGVATELALTGPFGFTWNTIADGDATPDVSGGMAFKTANTGATSITDFDGNTDCLIVLRSGDNNTTLVHDATKLVLKAGMNVAFNQDDTKWFAEDGGVWYEISNP